MKHFIKAINKGDMGEIKNILSRDSTQIDIDEAIKYTKNEKDDIYIRYSKHCHR